ncbi:putative peptidylprolyl isomerase [Cryptosporidium canis]|uniref:Peptidylprolyl isomerase n=1 Tax=Cryptosporidium canis TaxID=195482 RepID=A0A9D5DEW1_9CRYT|nr:putative peptidylprolyl isomerase [Cryptosporidium canis]
MSADQCSGLGRPETGDLVHIRYKTTIDGGQPPLGIKDGKFGWNGNELLWPVAELDPIPLVVIQLTRTMIDPRVEERICEMVVGESITITSSKGSDPLTVSQAAASSQENVSTTSDYADGDFKVTLELVSITKKEDVPDVVVSTKKVFTSPIQRMQLSLDSRNLGNHYYNLGDYPNARIQYENSIKYLDCSEEWTSEEQDQSKPLKISALLNISNCLIKLKEYKSVLKFCSETLNIDKVSRPHSSTQNLPHSTPQNNVKAMYLRAISNLELDDPEEARADLYKAATLHPQNVEVRTKLQQVSPTLPQRNPNHSLPPPEPPKSTVHTNY